MEARNTYVSHEMRRVLRVDESPLIGPTNLDWVDLCEKLLGVTTRRECSTYAWGPAVLAYLYREMCSAIDYKTKSIGANVMSALPPICLVGSVAWCTVVSLICFHVVEWHQPDKVLR
ncbi:Serine/threonine-protein phosphatase 7 long form [Glycine max]|nr:Serine/threonine-protein phosphatase 7 long form [Glycine max]